MKSSQRKLLAPLLLDKFLQQKYWSKHSGKGCVAALQYQTASGFRFVDSGAGTCGAKLGQQLKRLSSSEKLTEY